MGEPLYGLISHCTIGNRQFRSPPFTIEFETEFATSGKPNLATVRLYNPSQATIDAAKVKTDTNGRRIPPCPAVRVDAGYGFDLGQVIIGEAFTSAVKRPSPDVILEIKVSDATPKWREAWISKTYAKFADAKEILYDMLESVGIIPYAVKTGEAKTFDKAQSFNESLASAIARLCNATKSKYYFTQGRLVIEPLDEENKKNLVLLTPQSGLIGSPEPTDKGYKFQSLLNHRLGAGVTVAVKSRDLEGYFKIFRGKHSLNEITGTTEFEAKKVNL